MSDITLIGLGAMGSALGNAFLANGHKVTVWNRSPEKAQPLVAKGATHAASIAEALGASPLIVVCVLDYQAVRTALEAAAGQLAGRTLVNLTNGTPAQARELGAWAESAGASYIDGAIMVTPDLISQPEAFILYSGATGAFQSHQTTLGALGNGTFVGSDVALASLYDLALLSAMFGMFAGYLHAAALLRSERIRLTDVTPMIVSLLNAMVALLPQTANEVDTGDYPQPISNNQMMAAALQNILSGSSDQGVRTDLMEPVGALFKRGVAEGLGALDISALVPLLAARAAAQNRIASA